MVAQSSRAETNALRLAVALFIAIVGFLGATAVARAATADIPQAVNGEVTLTSNVTLDDDYLVPADVTSINLEGHTISTDGHAVIVDGATLTIDGNGTISGADTVLKVNSGAVTLSSGTLTNTYSSIPGDNGFYPAVTVGVSDNAGTANSSGSFTMTGGEIYGNAGIALLNGSVNLTGGDITTTNPTVYTLGSSGSNVSTVTGSSITINGKELYLTSTASAAVYTPVASGATVSCDVEYAYISGEAGIVNMGAELTVANGIIDGGFGKTSESTMDIKGADALTDVPTSAVVSVLNVSQNAPSTELNGGVFSSYAGAPVVAFMDTTTPATTPSDTQLVVNGGYYQSPVNTAYLAGGLLYKLQYGPLAHTPDNEHLNSYYSYFETYDDALAANATSGGSGNVTSAAGTVILRPIYYVPSTATTGTIEVTVRLGSKITGTQTEDVTLTTPGNQTLTATATITNSNQGVAKFQLSADDSKAPLEPGIYYASIVSGGSTLEAVTDVTVYKTVYDANGGTLTIDGQAYPVFTYFNSIPEGQVATKPVQAGYTFQTWSQSYANYTSTYTAQWVANSAGGGTIPPVSEPSADVTELTNLLNNAIDLTQSTTVSTNENALSIPSGELWTSAEAEDAIQDAIISVRTVLNNDAASQEEVDAAIVALNEALDAFKLTLQSGRSVPTGEIPDFSDVSNGDWFEAYVDDVAAHGLMLGYTETTFGPTDSLTRGQLAVILYRYGFAGVGAEAQVIPYYFGENFDDVDTGDYFYNAVCWASAQGIITGYNDTTFGPNDSISREQLATILYRFDTMKAGVDADGNTYETFEDYPEADLVNSWAIPGMGWAVEHGVLTGYAPTNALGPQNNVNRAQTAKMLTVAIGSLIGWGATTTM